VLTVKILTKLAQVLITPAYRAAFLRTGVAASTEHDHVLEGLGLDTVVDIGANRGQFALCARRLYPKAAIYSFEPLQRPAAIYRRVFKHDRAAKLFPVAIGAEAGSAVMHVSRWDVSSSLLPAAQAQHDNFPLSQEAEQESVTKARLSECLEQELIAGTALLKLDVQGYELAALRGCEDLLARFRYVYVEVSFVELYVGQALAGEILAYLLHAGYGLVCVANLSNGRGGHPIQADFLFART
jgi:FkbM family methyltransferase